MTESNTNKVLTWLQSAVGRVREFAYAEPPALPQDRPRIGVALGGGFARGIAHLGVLRVLEEEHIPVDYLTGTSAGALLAISYASGHSIPDVIGLSFAISQRHADLEWRARADIIIEPVVKDFLWDDFDKTSELMAAGEAAARAALPKIRAAIASKSGNET